MATAMEHQNKSIVESLYEALACGDADAVVGLLAADVEWWFHGPPRCQHMMRILTGETTHECFRFDPQSIATVRDRVVVEGWEGDEQAYWVHVWTVEEGLVTQFREYFNTRLTVREVSPRVTWEEKRRRGGPTLWQSGTREHLNRSLPGLILAI